MGSSELAYKLADAVLDWFRGALTETELENRIRDALGGTMAGTAQYRLRREAASPSRGEGGQGQ